MNLRSCTLTGIDTETDLASVAELGKLYPFAEWAVLYSPRHAGRAPRYPSLDWACAAGSYLAVLGIPRAVHLCGPAVRGFVNHGLEEWLLTRPFDRVQLNLLAKRFTADELRELGARVHAERPHQRLILQVNSANAALCRDLADCEPFEFLFDSSGGRGKSPVQWPSLTADAAHGLSQAACGYAGGMGPDNIADELARIRAASAGRSVWIDMEGKLRTAEDFFSLDIARAILDAVQAELAK